MRILIQILFFLLPFLFYELKGQSFCKNQIDLNLGFGIKPTIPNPGKIPLVIGNFVADYGITDRVSIGIYSAGLTVEKTFVEKELIVQNGTASWVYWPETHYWRIFLLGVRGAYHFDYLLKNSKMDLFTGAMLGNNIVIGHYYKTLSNNYTYAINYPSYKGGVIWSAFVGCRYRFNEKAGIFAELGYGVTYFSFGLNYKFAIGKKPEIIKPGT